MHHFEFRNLALSLAVTGALLALASTPAFAQAPPTAPAPGTGTGLWGEYFDNFDFTLNKPTRTDATVDFQNFQVTAIGTPTGLPATMTDHNTYVVRWQGLVEAPAGATSLTFYLRADDGSRLWIDGKLVSDFWRQGPIAARGSAAVGQTATISVAAGELHIVRAEFYEQGGGDGCGLDWAINGAAQSTAVAIPAINLYNTVAYPRFLLAPGAFTDTQLVRIVCDTIGPDVVLRYAVGTVGAPPADIATAADGLAYAGPIPVSTPNAVIKTRAFRASMPGATSIQRQGTFNVTDTTAPQLLKIQTVGAQELLLTFSEPILTASANTAANYTLSAGTVATATVQPNPNLVLLTTTALVTATDYVLTFPNAMRDMSPTVANAIPAGKAVVFRHVVPATANLVDWYRFDEATGTAAADASGSGTGGNAGTVEPVAVEPPVWVEGVIGTALYFNGINNAVVTAALEGVLGNTCSMSVWFKTQAKGYTSTTDVMGIVGVNAGTNDIKFGYFNGSGQFNASVGGGTAAVSNTTINDDAWHHLVITRDSGTGQLTIYVDAVRRSQVNSGTGAKAITFNKIGAILATASNVHRYLGTLDEVKFYNAVLTQNDVYDLYNAPPTVNAGPDQLLVGGLMVATLAGTSITDDGLPAPSALTWGWTLVSGPGTVTFGAATGTGASANTTATFSAIGTYVLRLTASDGSLKCSDDVTIDVPRVAVNPNTGLLTSENPSSPQRTATFNIDLVTPNAAPVVITITSSNIAEGVVSETLFATTPVANGIQFTVPTSLTPTTIPITVTGVADNIDDGDQPYTVTVDTVGPAGFTVTRVVTLTNLDVDTAGVTIVDGGGLLIDEGGAPISDTFTIRLNSIPTAPVTFNFAITPVAVLPDQSFTLNQPSVTFPATAAALTPVTITATAINDTSIELTRNFTILITQPVASVDPLYAPINPPDVQVTVLDDEIIPALPKVWGCGLSGLEILLPLGLAAFLRRRRRA